MMKNFPVPYPDELVYSVVARAGIRFAITSPKVLLGEVYQDRKIIATLDLPSHLSRIAAHLEGTGRYGAEELIYQHTMFPLYAPFIAQEIRCKAIDWMKSNSKGAVHLALGVAASKVKSAYYFRYCQKCMAEQLIKYGEYFWSRLWFMPGLACCPKHGALVISHYSPYEHRHAFEPCTVLKPHYIEGNTTVTEAQLKLSERAQELLSVSLASSPTVNQWSLFYRRLAHDFGCTNGQHVKHEVVYHKVQPVICVPELAVSCETEASWLRSIFRKHRKSFSYLQHLTIWQAFLPNMPVRDILDEVSKIRKVEVQVPAVQPMNVDQDTLARMRDVWTQLISVTNIKLARSKDQAIYTWLYRNDKAWLLAYNANHKAKNLIRKKRVDWHARDFSLTKSLSRRIYELELSIDSPRLSKSFLLKQVNDWRSVSKNLDKLPRVKAVIEAHSETVAEYQVRRLCAAAARMVSDGQVPIRWKLLRAAGLSKPRITKLAANALDWIDMITTGSMDGSAIQKVR